MSTDIYRGVPIATPTEEHVLPDGLGCSLVVRDIIDRQTNNDFGGTIDRDLVESLAHFRCLLGLSTRRGAPLVVRSDQGPFDLRSDGTPVPKHSGRPWEVSQLPDGKRKVRLRLRPNTNARTMVQHMLGALRADESQIAEIHAVRRSEFLPESQFDFVIGGAASGRSIAKAALNLWARLRGRVEVLSDAFAPVRSYVLEGIDRADEMEADSWRDAIAFGSLEPRAEFFAALPRATDSEFEHRVVLHASATSRVAYALVELFGHIHFSVLLSDAWQGETWAGGLFAKPEPEDQRHILQVVDPACCPALTAGEILAHGPDFARMGPLVTSLVGKLQARQRKLLGTEIVRQVLQDFLARHPGEPPISEELVEELVQDLASETVRHVARIDSEQPIDPRELGL